MAPYVFHLVPHTHWDREWYLPQPAFLARLVAALDDLLARLEADPHYRTFLLDGQTVLLEDYLRVRPEAAIRIRTLVRDGRLQVGPWYVLADEQIPAGESLVRNLLLGTVDAERLGRRLDVLYSPDAFGHPAVWPTLAREFGIRWGVLWRGLGGEPGQDRDLYRWRGPDGRELLLYHLPPDGYEVGASLPADPVWLPEVWARLRATLVARAASRHVAVFIGADHHAAHPELPRLRDLLAGLEPEAEVRISRLDEFFRAAEGEIEWLPMLRGELRWSYRYTWTLQGVHGTRAPLKRRHAGCELALSRVAEPLAALAALTARRNGGARRALLAHAWRALVRSEFHDSIGGCTSDEVAGRVEQRLDGVAALAREIARTSLDALVGNDPDRVRESPGDAAPRLLLWNPAPRRRGGIVVTDVTWFRRDVLVGPPGGRTPRRGAGVVPFALVAGNEILGLQRLGRRVAQERLDAVRHYPDQDEVDVLRVAFRAPPLGGMAIAVLEPGRPAPAPPGGAWARGRRFGNESLEVTVARSGAVRLRDLRTGQHYPGLLRLESEGDVGDTYTFCPPPEPRLERSAGPVAVRVLAPGPLVAALELRWRFAGAAVRAVLSLHAESPALRCTYELDNSGTDRRLRLRVPTGLRGGAALAGAAFGAVARPAVRIDPADYSLETPVATAPAHRFVARAEGERGLAVLAPGFLEYELTDRGDLIVTLLRAVGELSRGDLATRPGHAGWPIATPGAQCLGPDRLQLALCPVDADALQHGSTLEEAWEDVFLPPRAVWLRQASPLRLPPLDLRLEGAGLVFSALKPGEDGWGTVLRCYNATGRPVRGAWRFEAPVRAARRVRADERPIVDLVIEDGGRTVRFDAGPHEIVTIAVR